MSARGLPAAVVIVAAGLVLAAVLNGGLFDLRTIGTNGILLWRVNKLTGATYFCSGLTDKDSGVTKGCFELRDYDLRNPANDASDQAVAAAYLSAHPEEAAKYGLALPTPTTTPLKR